MCFSIKMKCQYYKKMFEVFNLCIKRPEKNDFKCKCGQSFAYKTQLLDHQTMCIDMEECKKTYNHIFFEENKEVKKMQDLLNTIEKKTLENIESDGYINLTKSEIKKNDSWEKL